LRVCAFSGLQLEITHDKFIRTTDPKHEGIVKEFYSRVLAKGDIYRADYEGLYCVNCEEYKVVPLRFYLFSDVVLWSNDNISIVNSTGREGAT